ncbi:transcription factor TRY [Citrus sinensis]|uniref:Transcription factor TRY n=1 Tax=Citrus sinensis TaxID=2711 RepID=A0ACB8HSR6_CITSI|nr:transcription factor TRY [Citrus sinensis]KAH9677346.1 transcription factor TRY [Citrus sinensis]
MESTSKRRRKQAKTSPFESEEVNSTEWEFIDMTEPEEDLIYRMWDLIAGRIPGRKAEEIERFWIMKNNEVFAERRKLKKKEKSKISP